MAMFQTLKLLPAHILGIEGELLGVLGFGFVGPGVGLDAVLGPPQRLGKVEPFAGCFWHRAPRLFRRADLFGLHHEPDQMSLTRFSKPGKSGIERTRFRRHFCK
jgi:hypothetical protein